MDSIIKKMPLPITGLMLGLVALGNLVQSYSNNLRVFFGIISGLILLLVIMKIFTLKKGVAEALENPVVASVFPTLSMAIILLAVYLKPISFTMAIILWFFGITLHIILVVWFTRKFVLNFNIKKVFPSWFIVYVGIVVASVTSGAFNMQWLGKILFYLGFIAYLVLLPLVVKRILIIKEMPEAALPTLAILSAPASLCLAGYINSFADKQMFMIYFLLFISQATYIVVLTMLPGLLKLKFYPSYSGFTFPLVISAISLKLTNGFLMNTENPISFLSILVRIEEVIAFAMVAYVLFRYIYFIFFEKNAESNIIKVAKV